MGDYKLPARLKGRIHWQRLTPELQAAIADFARDHGIVQAARRYEVSEGSVRRSCALNGMVPFAAKPVDKLATARALLRALGVKPSELL